MVARPQCGFVPQQPWLFNTTIKDNILFGTNFPFDAVRYTAACECCCLVSDFDDLPHGDATIVGDNGENLSGGQRQRVSLARAAYSRSSIVILDDVLSALDPVVATAVFERCVLGMMQDRTRVIVSHSQLVANCADQVFVVQDKHLTLTASSPHLKSSTPPTDDVHVRVPATSLNLELADDNFEPVPSTTPAPQAHNGSTFGIHSSVVQIHTIATTTPSIDHVSASTGQHPSSNLNEASALATNATESSALPPTSANCCQGIWSFAAAYNEGLGSGVAATFNILLFIAECTSTEIGVWYLAIYTQRSGDKGEPADPFFIYVYIGTVCAEMTASYLRSFTQYVGSHAVHQRLRQDLIKNIMDADISYFDKTPLSSILHLFSSDLEACDAMKTTQASNAFGYGVGYGCCVLVITVGYIPWLLLIILPLGAIFVRLIRKFYAGQAEVALASSRQASIFSTFVELMSGLPSVRAYNGSPVMYTRFAGHFDVDSAAVRQLQGEKDTLYMYVEWVGSTFLFGVVLAVAIMRDYDIGSDVASFLILNACFSNSITHLVVTTALELTEVAEQRQSVKRESTKACSSRNSSGSGSGSDQRSGNPGGNPGEPLVGGAHPGCGIVFDSVDLGYTDDADAIVINGLDLTIQPGERLGVVGRTGAGKSTLIRAISGLLAPVSGTVSLDGTPLPQVPEHKLRSLVAVINQTPHLFGGSIRFNLDPLHAHGDEAIFQALRRVHALGFINQQTSGLDTVVSAGGISLSAGERQLICLARALLQGAKIILLDEATAALDDELLAHIETALKECSALATIVQIAHQTSTVLPCDRVIVLHAGKIIEDGVPAQLCESRTGHFFGMAQQDSRRADALSSFSIAGKDTHDQGMHTTTTTAPEDTQEQSIRSDTKECAVLVLDGASSAKHGVTSEV